MFEICGHTAVVVFNPETNLFRGEFIDLDGGADFYAADLKTLQREGEISLKVFLNMCREDGVLINDEIGNELNRRVAFRDSHPHQGKSLEAIAQSLGVKL